MQKKLTIRSSLKSGAVLPMIAVSMVAFMGVLALAVDGGAIQRERRLLQNAADAGALAGAWEIYRAHNTDSAVYANVYSETARNGYTDGVDGVVVTPSRGDNADYYHGPQYVKVVVEKTISTPFAGIFRRSSTIVRARAWGGTISPSRNCIVSLATTGFGLHVESGAAVEADNCTFRLNSSSSNVLETSGGTIDMPGGSISVTCSTCTKPGEITPGTVAFNTGVAALPDPFGTVAAPSGFSTVCDVAHTAVSVSSGTVTLNPGVYCEKDNSHPAIMVSSSGSVVLTQGLYILLGGLVVKNNASLTNTGAGVTIYNTKAATCTINGTQASTCPYVKLEIGDRNTSVTLAADPSGTNGTLAGILFFGDRSVTGPTGEGFLPSGANLFHAGSTLILSGAVYFPTMDVRLQDTGACTISTGSIVASRVWMSAGIDVAFTGAGGGGGVGYFGVNRASVIE